MPDLPEAVARVLGFYDATAADLMTAGGILRCGTCGGERPLGDVAGYLGHGWPQHCGQTMTWVTLKQLAAESWDVPEGYELAAVADADWRLAAGKRCRRGASHANGGRADRRPCGRPSTAELKRGSSRPQWWAYCIDHLYGRWVENGKVMHWILREKENAGD